MIKLTKLVELKPLNEQEVFTATNKETGNVSVFKSKASRDAAVKSGSHEMRKDDKEDSVEKPSPKVNIFNKDKEEPKSEPKSDTTSSDSDDEFEFLDSFEMEDKLDSMDLSDDVRAELDRQIDYLQGQEYELENAREEEDDEAEAEIEDDIARTRDEIGRLFKSAKKNPSKQKPSKDTSDKKAPTKSSYSGDYQDLQKDMQNAFKSAGISNNVTSSFRFNDNHSQVHFEDEIDDDSLQSALDKFNQENGTNFQAGKVKQGPRGWYVAISEDPTHEKLQEQENTSMRLKDLLPEAETFTATNKKSGKTVVFKSKDARDAAVKSGSHEMRKDDKAGDVKNDKGGVNIFNKDKEEPKSEPKSSSYSGNTEDMKMDMQNAFETGYTGKGLKGVKKTKDGFQVNMASYMNDNSFKDVLDAFNKTNGTNFVADKVEKTAGGTRVSISEPKKDGPVKDSSGGRAGNPQVNKATKKKAEELGITPSELGREEYEKTMVQAAVAALTDSNYHSEARQLIAMIEDKPEWKEDPRKSAPKIDSPEYDEWRKNSVYSSEYYDADSATEELGQTASQEAGWNGVDALDGIAFELKTRGFVELAKKIQSVIKENKSTRLKDLV